jgi:hypothetical protein
MKTIFTSFLILLMHSAGAQITLSHNIGDVITGTNIHSCSWGNVYWARAFNLSDFGIDTTNPFSLISGKVAINPNWTAWDSKIQFNVYSIDSGFPQTFNTANLIGSSQIVDVWMITNPITEIQFESPIIVPSNVSRILVEVHQLPSLNSSAHLFCSGTAQDNDVSWFKVGMAGCSPFTYMNTIDIDRPDARFYITVTGKLGVLGNVQFSHDNFIIFPNPSVNVVNIQSKEMATYILYDILGQKVLQGHLNAGQNTIEVDFLSSGMYNLDIIANTGTVTRKKISKT